MAIKPINFKNMFSYRKILRQALNITWRYKFLWFFGLFATLLGAGGEYQILNHIFENNGETTISGIGRYGTMFHADSWANIGNYFMVDTTSAIISLLMLLLTLALAIFVLLLAVSSQGAIVDQTEKIINKKTKNVGLSQGTMIGQKYFWPVLGMNILIKVVIAIIFFLIALPILLSPLGQWLPIFIYVILFMIFVPVIIGLSLITKYAIAFIVIKKNKFSEAIENAWILFRDNWVVSLEMAFLLVIINILAGLVISIAAFAIAAPFIIFAFLLSNFAIFWLIAFLGLTALIVAIIWFGSMLTTFQISAWTTLYISLVKRQGKSKIKRLKEKARKRK